MAYNANNVATRATTMMSKSEVESLIKNSVNELCTTFCKMGSFFGDCASIGVFLNIGTIRRKYEYKEICMHMLKKKLIRLGLEILNVYPEAGDYKRIDIIPRGLFNSDRLDSATSNNLKQNLKQIQESHLDLEYEVLEQLKEMWYKLLDSHSESGVILAGFVKCFLDDVVKKIKYLERDIVTNQSADYDPTFILMYDQAGHDKYKEKLKNIGEILFKR